MHEGLTARFSSGWRDETPWGYPRQVELALIAGVYGAQVSAAGVAQVTDAYLHARPGSLLDDLGAIADRPLADLIHAVGDRWGDTTVLGVPVLRTTVIHEAASTLVARGVRSADDMRAALTEDHDGVVKAVLGIRGLGPGTWETIAVMVHADVPPTVQEVELARELTGDPELPADEVGELLRLTARSFAVDKRALMYALARSFEQ